MPAMQTGQLKFRNIQLAWYQLEPMHRERRPILFFHANGYPALTYTRLFEALTAAGHPVFALDFVGHGRSQPTEDFEDWNFFRDQAMALLNFLSESGRIDAAGGILVVGHSIGGATSSLLAALEEERARAAGETARIRALALLDPTVLTPLLAWLLPLFPHPLAEAAERRRAEFKSMKLVERSYRMHPGFKAWDDAVFQAYLASAFRKRDDGMYELCLPPRVEARIFRTLHRGQWRHHKAVEMPKLVIQATKSEVTPDRAARLLTRRNPNSQRMQSTGSHFFPMEQPAWTVEKVLKYFEDLESKDLL